MAIKKITLTINNKKGIPQVGDNIHYTIGRVRTNCIILSIESVHYDEKYKLIIEYKVKVIDEEQESNLYIVKE